MTDMTVAAPPKTNTSLVAKMASKFSVSTEKLLPTLKATAFRQREGEVTNEQMMALLIVADAYSLNPFTKEIYAFPDKGGIVPVVSVDGWSRIINEHPQMDGVEFVYGPPEGKGFQWIDCVIYRKDRSHPTTIREFRNEVVRDTTPWRTHSNRMHRHKALIQCARVAFGFAGIHDEQEAQEIIEVNEPPEPQAKKPTLKERMGASKPVEAEVVVEPAHQDPIQPSQEAAGAAREPEPTQPPPEAEKAPAIPFDDLLKYAKKAKSKDQGDVVLDTAKDPIYTDDERRQITEIINSKAYHTEVSAN